MPSAEDTVLEAARMEDFACTGGCTAVHMSWEVSHMGMASCKEQSAEAHTDRQAWCTSSMVVFHTRGRPAQCRETFQMAAHP